MVPCKYNLLKYLASLQRLLSYMPLPLFEPLSFSSTVTISVTIYLFFSFCLPRFGVRSQDLPHPEAEWPAFSAAVSALNDKEPMVWSSVTKNPAKWINMQKLTAAYGRGKGNGKSGSGKDVHGTKIGCHTPPLEKRIVP